MEYLEPCPCCGSESIEWKEFAKVGKYLVCLDCGLQTKVDQENKVRSAWNRRAAPAAIVGESLVDHPTLRDQFAMAALPRCVSFDLGKRSDPIESARLAYEYADAILAASKQKGGDQ